MKLTPTFLAPFLCKQYPLETGQSETDWREANWYRGNEKSFIVLSFISSWIFAPYPQDKSQEWRFGHRLQINDWTSGKAHIFQRIDTNFACPSDTPCTEVPQYLQRRRYAELSLTMPAFTGEQLEQAMRDFGFGPSERWLTSENRTTSCYSLRVTDDWTAHEKIQLREHPLVENYRRVGFDLDSPLRNFMSMKS